MILFIYSIKKTFLFFLITVRHKGNGHKRLYRLIDFKRRKLGLFARVSNFEYDPNRNTRIALLNYLNGDKFYIISPLMLFVGDFVVSDFFSEIKVGNSLPLLNIPLGTIIHNIELQLDKIYVCIFFNYLFDNK